MDERKADTVGGLFHVAIIMDGNGRWATTRGAARGEGHRQGAHAVRRTVRAAPDLGITTLTLFAFSSDNWKRPTPEVATLLRLFADYLRSERTELARNDIRLSVIGRRDRLPFPLVAAIEEGEAATISGSRLHLRIAIDYSARGAIVRAAGSLPSATDGSRASASDRPLASVSDDSSLRDGGEEIRLAAFRKRLGSAADAAPDVDLLIRTGGEHRLSDFLLWESAYAELCFLRCMWPDFGDADLAAAVSEFRARQRRFGGLPSTEHSSSARATDTIDLRSGRRS